MKSRTLKWITPTILFAVLALPVRLTAQASGEHRGHHRYKVIDIGTFGGSVNYLTNDNTGTGSASGVVNARGTVVSGAETSVPDPNFPNICLLCPTDPLIVHAFAWMTEP
jgi:hypothetical protein